MNISKSEDFLDNNIELMELPKQSFFLKSEIQRLTEANLSKVSKLVFIKSDFQLHGLRIDTPAFTKETNAFADNKKL